jgi:SAM-dependent methyltransferase
VRAPLARRILDFGCGVGWVLAEAQAEGEPLRFGVDLSLDALQGRCGTQLRADRENPHIELVAGDGTRLPFADEAFDVVIGHVSLPYMDTRDGLREIYRVLAPGGSVVLTFHSFDYLRKRLWTSLRGLDWKGVIVCVYLTTNGLLSHFALPQMPVWWNRSRFETVNTPHGVCKAAEKEGFTLISAEHGAKRIFFVVTARKLNPKSGGVLPAPGWAAYSDLASRL